MSRLPSWVLVLAVWAAIYLPALGSFEIKSEEGRRILPAITMLETGNYIVPQIGSDVYFSKPPLVNWLIAASFKLTGLRSEWTARLPSVLAVLLVAIVFLTVAAAALGREGATVAALIWLTTAGIIEKGRLIEIEAVYVSLCAVAIISWLSFWLTNRSPWLTWVVPWIWLGFGWLAKGPVHLVFFYAVVIAVLWQTKRLKELFHPAHFAGIAVMLGIFAAWAIPFLQMSSQARALTKWSAQFTGRVAPNYFHFGNTLFTLLKALGQFLPWVLLLPFVRPGRFEDPDERRLARALIWSTILPLILVSLVPVSAARYSLPVSAPFCWLLALGFGRNGFWPVTLWHRPEAASGAHQTGAVEPQTIGRQTCLALALIVAFCCAIGFPIAAQRPNKRDKVKSVAGEVNAHVPSGETLYAVNSRYQPFLFYVRTKVKAVEALDEIPISARYFFVRANLQETATRSDRWLPRHTVLLSKITDYRGETILLFEITEKP